MSKEVRTYRPLWVLALLLAWLVPGAGHLYIGRYRRGLVLLVTISALFWSGVALGGVLTVDYEAERWWFIADMFTGVNGLVSYQRQKLVYQGLRHDPEVSAAGGTEAAIDKRLQEKGLALVHPVDNVARAYSGVAGLLNLLCIFDAAVLALMGRFGEDKTEPVFVKGSP